MWIILLLINQDSLRVQNTRNLSSYRVVINTIETSRFNLKKKKIETVLISTVQYALILYQMKFPGPIRIRLKVISQDQIPLNVQAIYQF